MKPTALSLAIAAIAFGASTVYLSVQLHEERAQADKLTAETQTLNARIAELERFRGEHQAAVANPFSRSVLPPGPPAGQAVDVEETTGSDSASENEMVFDAPPRNEEVFKKMMRSQVRTHNKQQYGEVGALLGLTKQETSKLIDLLTEQQVEGTVNWSGPLDAEGALRQMAEKQRADKAQIAELIGADKADAFEEYQQSMPARQELEVLARQLDGADAPLSDDQQKRLLAILLEERKRVPAPKMTDAKSLEEYSKAYMAWQVNYEESVASQARTVLNAEQLSTYNEYQDWQTQIHSQMGPQMGVVRGGPNVMFTTAAPAVSAEVAIVAAPPEKPRK